MSLFTPTKIVAKPLGTICKFPEIVEIRIGGIIHKGKVLLISICVERILRIRLEITHRLSGELFVPIANRLALRKFTIFRSIRKSSFTTTVDRSTLFIRSNLGRRNITLVTS